MNGETRRPPARTFGALVRANAASYPERPALTFENRTETWKAFDAAVDRFARALLAAGIRRGSMVAVHAANRPEWLHLAMGCARIGARLAPLNTFHRDAEIAQQLGHSEPSLLFTVDRIRRYTYQDLWLRLLPELSDPARRPGPGRFARFPTLEAVVQLKGDGLPGAPTLEAWLAEGDAVEPARLAAAEAEVDPDDDLYILYTSGSTGVPKGVRLGQGHTIENDFLIGERQGLTHLDSTWIATPMFYGLATVNAIPAVWSHGGAIVLEETFDAGEALATIERCRPTTYVSLANMTRALFQHPDRPHRDISSLKKGIAGFSPEDMRLAIEGLGITGCCSMYGLTETYGNCFITEATDPIELRTTTQGRVLPGWRYRVLDEAGRPVPSGELGHLEIVGRATPGYLRNDPANEEAFTPDGWFRTGDLVRIGADGRLRFHGRRKEILKVGGVNVAPAEIEAILDRHPDVAECHVIGLPDDTKGEVIAAFVDIGGAKLSEHDIAGFVAENAARFKVPSHVFIMDRERLPRVASGKVPKYMLKELALKLLAERESSGG